MTTLSELKAKNTQLSAHCTRPGLVCGNSRALDLDMLIERFGADYDIIGETRIAKNCRCERCGYLGATLRINPDTSPKAGNPYLKAKGV